jgi:hypothetical protein
VLELALACIDGATLARALMTSQAVADESEARAIEAFAANNPVAGAAAMREALDAAASFARAEHAEFASATRWATHVVESRELALRALRLVSRLGA